MDRDNMLAVNVETDSAWFVRDDTVEIPPSPQEYLMAYYLPPVVTYGEDGIVNYEMLLVDKVALCNHIAKVLNADGTWDTPSLSTIIADAMLQFDNKVRRDA